MTAHRTFRQVWLVPIVMALLTLFGLLAALLGVGIWHWLAWTALVVPLWVCLWYGYLRQDLKA